MPYVNHYSFHILDAEWGHITIKISGHPPFPAQIMLNGHEYVAGACSGAGRSQTRKRQTRKVGAALTRLRHRPGPTGSTRSSTTATASRSGVTGTPCACSRAAASLYGYAAIFLVVMMESTGIPMPGETILISAAALAGTKHALDIRGVIAAAAGGAIVGDNIGFWVGREFGEPLLEKWGYLARKIHQA
jgi:hypothetical protein